MAKLFETSNDIKELIQNKFDETGLSNYGINLKILSITKNKNILKASRASATVQYLTNKDAILVVYEEALDKLSDDYKIKLIEGALSNIAYDTEKDRLNVESDLALDMFRMRQKYDNSVAVLETSYLVMEQIEEEEKEKKEAEKANKKKK
jgi:hypothetical protein